MASDARFHHPSLPPPRKWSPWWALIIVACSTLLAAAFLIGCLVVYWRSGTPLAVNDLDREALVTVRDVAPYVKDLIVRGDREQFGKRRFLGGPVELKYTYDHPETARPLYVECVIMVSESEQEARRNFVEQDTLARAGFRVRFDDARFKPRSDLFMRREGQTLFGVVSEGERPAGSYLAHRDGKVVFTLKIYGAVFEDPSVYERLVTPALDRLTGYGESDEEADAQYLDDE